MRKIWLSVLIVLSAGSLVPIMGCHGADDGLTDAQHQQADRLDQIAKQSDGNWDKVSQTDRDYILKNITSGSEQAAKMLLLAKAGKIGRGSGGSPTPGRPPAGGNQ